MGYIIFLQTGNFDTSFPEWGIIEKAYPLETIESAFKRVICIDLPKWMHEDDEWGRCIKFVECGLSAYDSIQYAKEKLNTFLDVDNLVDEGNKNNGVFLSEHSIIELFFDIINPSNKVKYSISDKLYYFFKSKINP